MSTTQVTSGPSRRQFSRIPAHGKVWVYWESDTSRDLSRVNDLSPSGIFLETRFPKKEGQKVRLYFLVQEGQICADAEVRHVVSGFGLGLKIQSISSPDVPRLTQLLTRLRESSRPTGPVFKKP